MKTEKQLNKLFNKRVKFLDDREDRLRKKVTSLERRLFQLISERIIDRMDLDGGNLKSNSSNIKTSALINGVFQKFNKDFNSGVIGDFVKDIQRGIDLSNDYFEGFTTETKFNAIKKRSNKIMLGRLGVDEKGNLTANGFLDSFLSDSSVKNEIAQATVRNVTSGAPLADFRNDLKTIIEGVEGGAGGALQKSYRTFVYDTYQEADRTYNSLIAEDLGLLGFRYSGGRINTTRKFCCQRNGLIFTKEEAEKWKRLDFQGKPKAGYDPITQLGGHRCKHNPQWLPVEMILLRRKDLKLEGGKLIYISGVPRQKLKQAC